MNDLTQTLWQKQDQHKGDRWRLFQAVQAAFPADKTLYPGSYVDIAPSFVCEDVTYVDSDRRAARFFTDDAGIRQIVNEHNGSEHTTWRFIASDYRSLTLAEQSFDLLVSLYAGFVSDSCAHLLKVNGLLLVNSSHGDAALAELDARFRLVAVVKSAKGRYVIDDRNLEDYFIPKKPQDITRESLFKSGRGIAYTKSPFAYLFRKISS